jgi:hypothetical protein
MTQIILDTASANALAGTRGDVTVCDPTGKVIGRFRRTLTSEEMEARNPFTLEDLEEARRRAAEDGPAIPLAEVWKQIRSEAKG